MRRLFAILAVLVLVTPAWAASINQSNTQVSTLITFTIDDSVGLGVWSKTTDACSSFRATFEQSNATTGVQFELHAVNAGQTPGASTLIQTFTASVTEPGTALNATGRHFMLNITRAESDSESRLVLRCSNAQSA